MSVSLIKVVVRRKYQQHTGSTDHVWFVKKLRTPQACYIYIALAHHKTGKLRGESGVTNVWCKKSKSGSNKIKSCVTKVRYNKSKSGVTKTKPDVTKVKSVVTKICLV